MKFLIFTKLVQHLTFIERKQFSSIVPSSFRIETNIDIVIKNTNNAKINTIIHHIQY